MSCSKKGKVVLEGYFYDEEKAEIYHFEKGRIQIYNIMDSVNTSSTFSVNGGKVLLGEKIFKQEFNEVNSVSFLSLNKKDTISLRKFKYEDFSIKDLTNSTWEYIRDDQEEPLPKSFIRIDEGQSIYNFIKHKNENLVEISYQNNYIGKYFDKFHCYGGVSPFLMTGKDSLNLFILEIINLRFLEESKYLKINKEGSEMILGKWKKLPDKLVQNKISYSEYFDTLDNSDKNYSKKKDSLKVLIDHSNLEFTSDGFFSRIIERNNNVFKFKSKFHYDAGLNFVFIDDINYDNKYFKVRKLTKDTLRLEISEPEFLYTYIRVKDSLKKTR